MNSLMSSIDEIKEKLTDMEYKTLCDKMIDLHKQSNNSDEVDELRSTNEELEELISLMNEGYDDLEGVYIELQEEHDKLQEKYDKLKKKKLWKMDKILNPETGRYVLKGGKLGQQIIQQQKENKKTVVVMSPDSDSDIDL